jgi:septum formation protein
VGKGLHGVPDAPSILSFGVRLILASRSPRRADLLRAAGFVFDIALVDVDERVLAGEPPSRYVRRLAAEKSAAAQRAMRADGGQEPAVVLGADTAVVVDGEVLGKPADAADAAAMLRRLSGRRHEVLTGMSLRAGAYEVGRVDTTVVEFSTLEAEAIAWYVASGEGIDKAGGYAIQGLAARFIPRIVGSYTNVVGLPVASVAELLRDIPAG